MEAYHLEDAHTVPACIEKPPWSTPQLQEVWIMETANFSTHANDADSAPGPS
jgi:hypothetical protein